MYNLEIKDINIGFKNAVDLMKSEGVIEDSRNGPVLRLPAPIMIQHSNPLNRYLLSMSRDANPFFHLIELMWMLDGDNDLGPLLLYNPGMAQYSDDGSTLRGTAYGHRWRKHFGFDQLESIVEGLKTDPVSRRYVMSMWDPQTDLKNAKDSKDLACNLQVIFSLRAGDLSTLDMTVTNRSNDLIYGCLGSNVFHFSGLLEYVCARTGLKVGNYYQFSTNLHLYTENAVAKRCLEDTDVFIPYEDDSAFQQEFFNRGETTIAVDLMNVKQAYRTFKAVDHQLPEDSNERIASRIVLIEQAIETVGHIQHKPTSTACSLWLSRRLERLKAK